MAIQIKRMTARTTKSQIKKNRRMLAPHHSLVVESNNGSSLLGHSCAASWQFTLEMVTR